MKLIERKPTHFETSPAFVDWHEGDEAHGELREVSVARYARDERTVTFMKASDARGFGARDVANALELTMVEASDLRRGKLAFVDDGDLQEALARIARIPAREVAPAACDLGSAVQRALRR